MDHCNNCDIWCLMASGLFAAMLYVMFSPSKTKLLNAFIATLNPKQKHVHRKIVEERLNIYITGLVLGLIVGFTYLSMSKKSVVRTCVFTTLVLSITIVFYMMIPKSTYMIQHLKTTEQFNKWLDVYKEMQYRNYMGLILGVISYLVLAHNL